MTEEETIEFMISIYCKQKHKNPLCDDCAELLNYAKKRISLCRHKETKNFCSTCKTHCYSPKMREEIKKVMKFSGPRMLLYNPKLALFHVFCTLKHKYSKEKL